MNMFGAPKYTVNSRRTQPHHTSPYTTARRRAKRLRSPQLRQAELLLAVAPPVVSPVDALVVMLEQEVAGGGKKVQYARVLHRLPHLLCMGQAGHVGRPDKPLVNLRKTPKVSDIMSTRLKTCNLIQQR
jgi:hypothetical protein